MSTTHDLVSPVLRSAVLAAALGALLAPDSEAQAPPEEFLELEPVLKAAMARVAPSIVTVETFGGTRKVLAGGGRGAAADAPRPEKGKGKGKGKGGKKKKGLRIKQPGFLQAQGATTGIVLTADGWILMSRFGLNFDPPTILVTLPDGRSFNAERGGEDTSRGIALIKIDAQDLPVPDFAATETLQIGQWAFALGRTFGRKTPSVHMGIVSARGRQFGRALQTDAYTSPANYGGPIVDIEGRILGISVPLSQSGRDAGVEWYDSGIGFGATIDDIAPLIERMKQGEVLHRGWLGVQTDVSWFGPGAKLSGVASDSAAAEAGVAKGDIIVGVDGVEVQNSFHLQTLVSSKMGGDEVKLTIARAPARRLDMAVKLRDVPEAARKAVKPSEDVGELPWEQGEPKKSDR